MGLTRLEEKSFVGAVSLDKWNGNHEYNLSESDANNPLMQIIPKNAALVLTSDSLRVGMGEEGGREGKITGENLEEDKHHLILLCGRNCL